MDQRAVVDKVKKDLEFLSDDLLGVLLYGSWARGEGHDGSDIDICIVAPDAGDKTGLWRGILSHLRDERYDVRIFELYEYFYPFRRIWGDQKHRQRLSRAEALAMFSSERRPA